MNSVEFPIDPPIPQKPQLSSKGQIKILELEIFKSVRIMVDFLDNENKIVDRRFYILEGEDYNNWGTDDNYVVEWIKQKIRE